MIVGLGIDVVAVARFNDWVGNSKKGARFFNAMELEYVRRLSPERRAASFAVRFAAKEAFGKAIGRGLHGIRLVDIAVRSRPDEAPRLQLFNSARKMVENIDRCRIHISLAHSHEYATACVVIEGGD